jgi:hypothetical protein
VYFSDVDDENESDDPFFEITVRSYKEPEIPGKTVVWGIPATKEKVASRVLVRWNQLIGKDYADNSARPLISEYEMQLMRSKKASGGNSLRSLGLD